MENDKEIKVGVGDLVRSKYSCYYITYNKIYLCLKVEEGILQLKNDSLTRYNVFYFINDKNQLAWECWGKMFFDKV